MPAQRTVWMLAGVTLLHSSGRSRPWPLILLAAAVAVTLVDPWALLQPGFWLSFAAVGLLLAADSATPPVLTGTAADGQRETAPPGALVRRLAELIRSGLRTQAIASFGLAPLTLIFFQQPSLVGLLANLVAIPRNRFGHPAADVLERYQRRGIRRVLTSECGEWQWRGEQAGHCERDLRRLYWHRRGAPVEPTP